MRKTVTKRSPPECGACATEIANVLREGSLKAAFRPVADLSLCGIFGYIVGFRGPDSPPLGSFARLADVARQVGMLPELVRSMGQVAFQRFEADRISGVLFLPLPPGAIEASGPGLAEELQAAIDAVGAHTRRVALVIPESQPDRLGASVDFAAAAHSLGFRLVAHGFDCALAERRMWSNAPPDVVLLDERHIEGLDAATALDSASFAKVAREAERGCEILVDGIRNSSHIGALRQLGVRYGAGDFIGRSNVVPARALPAAAHKTIVASCGRAGTGQAPPRGILDRLLMRVPPVSPEMHADQVFVLFEKNPDLRAIAVVKDNLPCGLISRYEMVDNMARPFRHELYGRKPCTRFMDRQPLVVDIGIALPELSGIVVNADPRHLISGFIITDRDRYVGMGSVQDLVREVTAMQMEAAKYANPLTQLPGNVPINQHIDNQLMRHVHCCIAYCDLDHFKPFNDVYGYAKGDEVIQLTARVLAAACDAERDFVGHIGGDDFVMVFRSLDWERRCRTALAGFGVEILHFFNDQDIERGGYVTENRKGDMEFHRLTSLSIGAVEAPPGAFQNHLQVSKVAAEVKKCAKAIPGNSLFINQRAGPLEARRD